MPDVPDDDDAATRARDAERVPLTYRAPADDRPAGRAGRAWALARAWFYTVFFCLLFAVIGSVFVATLVSGVEWSGMLGAGSMTVLLGAMAAWSIQSIRLISRGRISAPFETPRDRGPLDSA